MLPAMRNSSGQLTCRKAIAVARATALTRASVIRAAWAANPKKIRAISPDTPTAEISHVEFALALSGAAAGNPPRAAWPARRAALIGNPLAAGLDSSTRRAATAMPIYPRQLDNNGDAYAATTKDDRS